MSSCWDLFAIVSRGSNFQLVNFGWSKARARVQIEIYLSFLWFEVPNSNTVIQDSSDFILIGKYGDLTFLFGRDANMGFLLHSCSHILILILILVQIWQMSWVGVYCLGYITTSCARKERTEQHWKRKSWNLCLIAVCALSLSELTTILFVMARSRV